jgi:hypothetical protein
MLGTLMQASGVPNRFLHRHFPPIERAGQETAFTSLGFSWIRRGSKK